MTKRACPFDNHIHRQLKMHLSDYENDLNSLKDIQERTLNKLIEGSRRLYSGELDTKYNEVEDSGIFRTRDNQRKHMQKFVTNYFALNGKFKDRNSKNSLDTVINASRCSFCEIDTRLYQCMNCLELYCSSCTFINYESFEERRICMSCS